MNPLRIVEDQCTVLATMKLVENNPGKTTAELEKLTHIEVATFYRYIAKLKDLDLIIYKQKITNTGKPVILFPKYKLQMLKI